MAPLHSHGPQQYGERRLKEDWDAWLRTPLIAADDAWIGAWINDTEGKNMGGVKTRRALLHSARVIGNGAMGPEQKGLTQ
jgi:hypothetical protein